MSGDLNLLTWEITEISAAKTYSLWFEGRKPATADGDIILKAELFKNGDHIADDEVKLTPVEIYHLRPSLVEKGEGQTYLSCAPYTEDGLSGQDGVIVSEIMPNPAQGSAAWVELYNLGLDRSLEGCTVCGITVPIVQNDACGGADQDPCTYPKLAVRKAFLVADSASVGVVVPDLVLPGLNPAAGVVLQCPDMADVHADFGSAQGGTARVFAWQDENGAQNWVDAKTAWFGSNGQLGSPRVYKPG